MERSPNSSPDIKAQRDYIAELRQRIQHCVDETNLIGSQYVDEAGEYLFCELTRGKAAFCISQTAFDLWDAFQTHLRANSFAERFESSVKAVHKDAQTTFGLISDWVGAFLAVRNDEHEQEYASELATVLMRNKVDTADVIGARVHQPLSGLLGSHAVIDGGKYDLHFNEFMSRLANYDKQSCPASSDSSIRRKSSWISPETKCDWTNSNLEC